MPTPGKERQKKYVDSQKEKGYVLVSEWVPAETAAHMRKIAAALRTGETIKKILSKYK